MAPPVGAPATAFGLRSLGGQLVALDVARWFGEAEWVDLDVLDRAVAPVLDVGCGPGRHTRALQAKGVAALGLDVSPAAVRVARERGTPAVCGSIFEAVPGEGGWGSVLLLDGNVGIGGDPVALLWRVREVLRPGGRLVLELEPPGVSTESFLARLDGDGSSAWFAWARVGIDGVADVAAAGGFEVREHWTADGRWFGRLDAR
ncbi:MAG TPA: class I SAM-dependent methyltransferase [Actinomycetota bacterium]